MNEQDREIFYRTWSAAWEQHGKSMTPGALKMAFECLREYTISDIQRAVLQQARDVESGQFPPKPADIIRQIDGRPEDRALIAWAHVHRGICGEYGNYRAIVFDDPIVHQVVHDMGGFSRLGYRNTSEIPFMQKDFVDRYKAYHNQGCTVYPASLSTGSTGIPGCQPLLIGDKAKCMAILEGSNALVAA